MKKIILVLVSLTMMTYASDSCKDPEISKMVQALSKNIPMVMDKGAQTLIGFVCLNSRYHYTIQLNYNKGELSLEQVNEFLKPFQNFADSVNTQTKGLVSATYTIRYKDGEIIKIVVGSNSHKVIDEKIKAQKSYKKACDNNKVIECSRLGTIYYKGDGVLQDKQKAKEYFAKTCNLGEMKICAFLGIMYVRGDGIVQDTNKAKELFKKACDSGHKKSCFYLEKLNEQTAKP